MPALALAMGCSSTCQTPCTDALHLGQPSLSLSWVSDVAKKPIASSKPAVAQHHAATLNACRAIGQIVGPPVSKLPISLSLLISLLLLLLTHAATSCR